MADFSMFFLKVFEMTQVGITYKFTILWVNSKHCLNMSGIREGELPDLPLTPQLWLWGTPLKSARFTQDFWESGTTTVSSVIFTKIHWEKYIWLWDNIESKLIQTTVTFEELFLWLFFFKCL